MNEILIPQWSQVSAWAEQRLKDLRARNDDVSLGPTETAVVRGEIRALKQLIGLPETLAARQPNTAPPAWPGGDEA